MSYQHVIYSQRDEVAHIELNRPQRYNSFTDEMHAELRSVLEMIEQNHKIRCLVISGAGKAFCTGQDLNDRYALVNQGVPDLGESLKQNYNQLISRISALRIPVICAVNGVAAGAGVSLALGCDIVLAAKSAQFNFAFSKVGLIPDAGATWALVQAIGLPRARAVALLGETLSATTALEYGLIYGVVDDDELMREVSSITARLIEKPATGLKLTKQAMKYAAANNLEDQLAVEAQLQKQAGKSNDYAEAIRAFVEKRLPRFKHQ